MNYLKLTLHVPSIHICKYLMNSLQPISKYWIVYCFSGFISTQSNLTRKCGTFYTLMFDKSKHLKFIGSQSVIMHTHSKYNNEKL